MDPTDFFVYDEFLDPEPEMEYEYECPHCGTRFGEECVGWNDATQCHIAVCPGCGEQMAIDDEEQS
jgi:transcription elongation factor Elf1